MKPLIVAALFVVETAAACTGASRAPTTELAAPEAVALSGEPLYPIALTEATRRRYEEQLSVARAEYERNPESADAVIWLGRRTAYLGHYREVIRIFTKGIERHPRDARFYRHRGHRYITTRQFGQAIKDLQRAAELVAGRSDELEPDGLPNARNIPTSTLQFNIWYHLGLAHYLEGDLERALSAYREGIKVSTRPDMLVAMSHWLYMTLRRLGETSEAQAVLDPISRDMPIIENDGYHRLLLMYKGELTPDSLLTASTGQDGALDDATLGYGVGNWYHYNGNPAEAERIFQGVVADGQWPAFGYIAAEAELRRTEQGTR